MKLAALRKLAVRSNLRVRFDLPGGMEGCVDEHGLLRIPSLAGPAGFDVEAELACAERFRIEPVAEAAADALVRTVTRGEIEALLGAVPQAPAPAHEEE